MRVLMFTWEYPPYTVGGLGSHVAHLVPALARQGVELYVVTPRFAGGPARETTAEGAHIIRVDPPVDRITNLLADVQQTNLNLEEAGAGLVRELDKQVDIIHGHDWLVAYASNSLKRLYKIPLVATIHATERGRCRGELWTELNRAINGVEWWLCYEAWRVITLSRYMADEVKHYFDVPADKVDIVPTGIDTRHFDEIDGELAEFRARFAQPEEKLVFHVGRLVREKGAHVLLEAVPRVLARVPNTRFVFAGRGHLLDELTSRARALGVSDRVVFAGYVADADRDRLFKLSDCAVFPSLYEPFGIVVLEAMAARSPVVVTNTGGLAEVVKDMKTGLVVEPDNPDALAAGIVETLVHPELARARADHAYEVVNTDYTWDQVARVKAGIYRRVVSERATVNW